MNRLFSVLVLLCFSLFVGVGVASADTLEFTLDKGLVPVAVFDLTVNSAGVLTPSASDLNFGFVVQPTNLTVNGAAAPTDFLAFYNGNPTIGGGVAIFASAFSMPIYASGPQIYGGDENAPTFALGTLSLADGKAAKPAIGDYTLTIKDLSNVSTPEPSVTILLAIGLLAVGLSVLKFKPNFGVSGS